MFFVREALEQATHERIASYHSSKFPKDELVVDMTAGIGADAIALSRRGPIEAFELDPMRAECCRRNLALEGEVGVGVRIGDSMTEPWTASFAFADPARRIGGQRVLEASLFSPDPRAISRRFRDLRLGLIKLSPLLPDELLESLGEGLEFVSLGGECREALVICGSEARSGRFAVQIETGASLEESDPAVATTVVGDYIYDSDPACIRAHALGRLCRNHELSVLGDSVGYLTGSEVQSPWLRSFKVVSSGRFDRSELKSILKREEFATPVLKQRGAGLDLAKLLKEFRSTGSRSGVIFLYKVEKSIRYVLADPVKNT